MLNGFAYKRLFLAVALGICTFQIARSFQNKPETRPVKPFTIIQEDLVGGEVSTTKMQVHSVFAVRGDGARTNRPLTTGRNNTFFEARNVLLPSVRKYIVFLDAIKAKSTLYVGAAAVEDARHVKVYPKCEDPTEKEMRFIREDRLLNFTVYEYDRESADFRPGVKQQLKQWLAPDLDCRALKTIDQAIDGTGKILNIFERTALSIAIGEPMDPSWFDSYESYREIPPSQANRELVEFKTSRSFDSDARNNRLLKGLVRMDAKYWESQKWKP